MLSAVSRLEVSDLMSRVEAAGGKLPQHGDGDQNEAAGGATELQRLELQNMDLQAQIIQQSGDNAKLKIRERELTQQVWGFLCGD